MTSFVILGKLFNLFVSVIYYTTAFETTSKLKGLKQQQFS